jgi:tetratricopeptide (TPR) repeat protein
VLARLELGLDKFKSEDQTKLLEGLTQLYFQVGERGEARRLSEQLAGLDQHRTDLRLHSFLFDLALKEGDEAGMEQTLAKIQEIEQSRGAYYRYGRALQLLWKVRQGNPSGARREAVLMEARQHLELASRQRPSWPPIHLARAEIYELEGNPEQAILELKQAIQKGENSPAVVQRLVQALVSRKRDAEADEELKKLKQTLLVQSELGRLAARVALRRGDTARALVLARDAVAVDSPDYGDQVWMGRLLAAANVHDEAEQKLRKAAEAQPGKPEAWVALVQLLASRNRIKDARTVLDLAREKIEPKSRPLALAQCAEALGETQDALSFYESAQKADPSNVMVLRSVIRFSIRLGQRARAEGLLRQIVDGKIPASKEDVNWARQGLALLLADGIHYDQFQQAVGYVDLAMDADGRLDLKSLEGKAPTDLHRTRARILATQPIRQYQLAAIGLFTLLDGMQALTPEDRLILAILLDRTGEWQKARDQYLTLVLPKTDDPRHLTAYVSAMLAHDDLDGIPRWLEQLEALEKADKAGVGAFGSVELRVRWMIKRGQKDAALDLLRRHVSRASASLGEKLLLAKYLGKEKRMGDALALCEEVWKKCPPDQVEQVGGVTMAVLRSAGQPTEADLARVETWLNDALRKEPDRAGLRMFVADLYELRGQYREAEAEYRAILASKQHSTNIVALNNLAWLLTLQAGKQEEALDLISRAIKGYGPRSELLDTRGMIYLALGRHEEALADLKEAADEPNPVRLFHLAQAFYETRDRENARRKLEQAREMGLDPSRMHPVEQRACKKLLEEFRL